MEYPTGEGRPRLNRLFLRRTFCIMAVCGILLFIPLIITLFHMMITKHDVYESQAIENQTRSTTISADRGTIYDRNMNVLASSSTVENVFLDPLELSQDKVDLNQLAQDLGKMLKILKRPILLSRPPIRRCATRSSSGRSLRTWPMRSGPM